MPSRDRTVGTPGQDNPGVSLHPLSVDGPDHREPGERFGVGTGMPPAPQPSLRWKPLSPLGISPLFVASFFQLLVRSSDFPLPQFTLSTAFFLGSDLCPSTCLLTLN